jgi:hypothetical protein
MSSMSSLRPGVRSVDKIDRSLSRVERMARVWSLPVLIDLANVVDSVMNLSRSRVSVETMKDL